MAIGTLWRCAKNDDHCNFTGIDVGRFRTTAVVLDCLSLSSVTLAIRLSILSSVKREYLLA